MAGWSPPADVEVFCSGIMERKVAASIPGALMALIGLRESRTQIAKARKNPGRVSRSAKSRFPVILWRV